tara:strand:- start:331 stop:570 length:240 start_codon:yes stop_codon:yes gene_type:complete
MDPITHTLLAVGSLLVFFFVGEWIGGKKKTDDVLEKTVALTIETLERDGFIRTEIDKDGDVELIPISELITDAVKDAKV